MAFETASEPHTGRWRQYQGLHSALEMHPLMFIPIHTEAKAGIK